MPTPLSPHERTQRLQQLEDTLPASFSSNLRNLYPATGDDLTRLVDFTTLLVSDDVCNDQVIEYLADELYDDSASVRQIALQTIQHFVLFRSAGIVSPVVFRRLADCKDPEARMLALNTIKASTINSETVQYLIDSLDDADVRVRGLACGLIGAFRIVRPQILSKLSEWLDSEDTHRKLSAILTLGYLGSEASVTLPRLISELQSGNRETAFQSADAISKIRLDVPEALQFLLAFYPNSRGELRRLSIEALARFGSAAAPVAVYLRTDATDDDENLRLAAGRAIAAINDHGKKEEVVS